MRISDWSSDVCSSDLASSDTPRDRFGQRMTTRFTGTSIRNRIAITVLATVVVVSMISTAFSGRDHAARLMNDLEAETQVLTSVFGDTLDRKSVGEGKRVSGRVELGGRRFIKKKKK